MAEALSHGLVTGRIDLARLNKSISYWWRGNSGWHELPDWLSLLSVAFGANLGAPGSLRGRFGFSQPDQQPLTGSLRHGVLYL